MFAPSSGVARILRPARLRGRSPSTCAHGRIPFGEEIEIAQGVEVGARRSSSRASKARQTTFERVEVGGSAVIVARGELKV
jgi:trans-2,3-dihydro-3-hydroxyanthranilate isomerase